MAFEKKGGKGGKESGAGHGSWARKRKAGGGGGEDFRWRKKKKSPQAALEDGVPFAEVIRPPSGDAIDGDFAVPEKSVEVTGEIPEGSTGAGDAALPIGKKKAKKQATAKQKEKLAQVKERRRKRFEEEREAADLRMKEAPAAFLWEKYVEWAGPERLSTVERKSEVWSGENVQYLHVEEQKEVETKSTPAIIAAVKKANAGLYALAKEPRDGVPGVSVLLVAASGLRASQLGRAMYDGKPVGKLFSKHISKEEQREWLEKNAKKKAAPTAVGTARRLHVLCEEGTLSLACTTVFIIDMNRDKKLQTVLDMAATRDELFDFIHVHLRPHIAAGNVKVLLHCSQ